MLHPDTLGFLEEIVEEKSGGPTACESLGTIEESLLHAV